MTQALLNQVSAKLMTVAGCLEVEFHINPRIIMIFWPTSGLALLANLILCFYSSNSSTGTGRSRPELMKLTCPKICAQHGLDLSESSPKTNSLINFLNS